MAELEDPDLNGDLSVRITVHSQDLAWAASPSATVWRKRLHRVGPSEAGQVTSVVRYEPGSQFHVHDHPEGEEILVLEGVFSDEHGDWPAGTYLLNPEGFRHAPFSREGCVLFVKLRQAAGKRRRHIELRTDALPWQPTHHPGIECKALADAPEFPDSSWLERWAPGTAPAPVEHPGGVELFVLQGELLDAESTHGPGSWLRLPAGLALPLRSDAGCELYVKYGGVAHLRDSDAPR